MTRHPSPSTPASPSEAKSALVALFEAFPTDRGEGTAAVATYLIAIEGYSLRAVQGAVKRIIRGEADGIDRRFLPTPAQLSNLVAYLEKLYAPPEQRLALPSPGSETRTEEEWARREQLAASVRDRFGIKHQAGGEVVVDREAIPAALREERDRVVAEAASKLKGRIELSEEARAIFRESAERAVPSPDEQYEAWEAGRSAA